MDGRSSTRCACFKKKKKVLDVPCMTWPYIYPVFDVPCMTMTLPYIYIPSISLISLSSLKGVTDGIFVGIVTA
jgi:hypothetical protein